MAFEDVLAGWLVKQRWFAGKGRTVHDLAVVADTEIVPGDPGLRQLLVTVSHGATPIATSCSSACGPGCPPGSGTPGSVLSTGCRSTTGCTTAT